MRRKPDTTRPMKDLSLDERKQILLDYQVMTPTEVKAKWRISQNVLGHIRFFYGKSSAVAGGYYHKDILEGAVHPTVARIRELKEADLTSLEIAAELKVPLEVVNRNW